MNKRKVLDTARKYVQKGAKQKALKEYERLLKLDPKDGKLRLEIGDAHRRWGQIDEATSQYTKVADQYKQDGFDARSVAVYKQVLNLDPKRYSAYVALSELYQRMGLDSEAISALQAAADGYHKEGQKREALELLRKMATLDPTNTTSRMKVAELLQQEGLEDDAIAEYEAVALEMERQGALEQVAGVYARILEAQPGRVDILVATARTLVKLRQPERAEPFAKQAAQADPTDIEKAELLCDIYKALDRMEELSDATRALAKIYRDRGDDDRAREIMQRVPATESMAMESEEPSFGAAEDFSAADDDAELEDDDLLDEDFLATDDNEISMTMAGEEPAGRAVAPREEGAADESEEEPLPDGDPEQLFAEASVYLRYGKRDQAIASLRAIVTQEPTHRGALEKLGEAYAEGGDNDAAVETWIKAAEWAAGADDAGAFDILRGRIAALDSEAAAGLAAPASSSATRQPDPADPAPGDESPAESTVDAAVDDDIELDIDIDMDVDVDAEPPPAADAAMEFDDGVEIDLDAEGGSSAAQVANDTEDSVDLDLDLDLDADGADAAPASADSVDAAPGSADSVDADIDVDVDLPDADDLEAEGAGEDAAGLADELADAADELGDELTGVEAELGVGVDDDDADIDVVIDDSPDDLVAAAEDDDEAVLDDTSEVDIDVALDDDAPPAEAASRDNGSSTRTNGNSLSATTSQQITDELEEAEFYFGQGMHDEAEAIYRRVLELAPSHPSALLRLGEIFAARGGDAADATNPDEASATSAGEGALSTPTLDQATDDDLAAAMDAAAEALSDDDEDTESAISVDVPAQEAVAPDADVGGEVPDLLAGADADAEGIADGEGPGLAADLAAELSDDTLDVAADEESESDDTDAVVADAREETQPIDDADPAEATATDIDPEASAQEAVESGVDEEAMFDLAAELREAMEGDEEASSVTSAGTEEDGFDAIFSEFKKGVSRTLSEGDTETRYDLGIAYREMELFEDAIGEFRVCLESDGRRLDGLTMMALCAMDVGRPADAVAHFEQALATGGLPEEQRTGLQYDLGLALEQTGDVARATASFEQVAEVDPNFRNVGERLAELENPSTEAAPAEDDEDTSEGFESFDDIIADAELADAEPEEEAETFESFDDVIADAEAIDPVEAEVEDAVEAGPEPEEDSGAEVDVEPPGDDDSQDSVAVEVDAPTPPAKPKGKGKKKKISFV